MDQLLRELPARLASGEPRVLKQYRGNGVWKVELLEHNAAIRPETILRVRHAQRGSVDVQMSLDDFLTRCKPYFAGQGQA